MDPTSSDSAAQSAKKKIRLTDAYRQPDVDRRLTDQSDFIDAMPSHLAATTELRIH